jgi:peroxiredoxin
MPRARGDAGAMPSCTEQACGFRDHHRERLDAGAAWVVGLAAQSTGYQRGLVHRLRLPYPLLADPHLTAARTLGLPTFSTGGMTLYRRLTLIVIDGVVEHVFASIPQPAHHAEAVLGWLTERNTR